MENPTWNEIYKLRLELKETNFDYWLNENLFTFPWWFLLITMILFFILWWLLLDKSRMMEILLYGFVITTIVILLDVVGVSFILWGYPNKVTPLVHPIVAIDIGHLPIIYMIIYQYFSTWKSFFIVMTITAAIFAYVFEPMTIWLGIYELNNWRHIFSFLIYIWIGVFCKWFISKIKQIENKEQKM
ncbi:CBO0543 family protein [Halalkalibacter sp. APA_J-10(15)]|uniref:CBO0543 family protein n=1 Tax=unclassified Halalkalibacter TaxID=2893063 RepID=UPI001FF6E5C7|nr:CBO0543 family protein [Halalkalibacter sp. APA_J-10(15)]MCK0471173.1 hypothetical protein [Halalkalibacter sp. APA_J-10(15)]